MYVLVLSFSTYLILVLFDVYRYNPTQINLVKLELKTCKLVLWDPLIPPLISKSDQIYMCDIYCIYLGQCLGMSGLMNEKIRSQVIQISGQ